MSPEKSEARAIARLYGRDPSEIVGWLYVWNTGELTIRWIDRRRAVRKIDPPIAADRFTTGPAINVEILTRIGAMPVQPSRSRKTAWPAQTGGLPDRKGR